MKRATTAIAVTAAILLSAPSFATAQTYTPVNTPGPALSVPQGTLDAALVCSTADLSTAARPPVLLIPGTTLNPNVNFDWNWMPALDMLNWEWCSVALPDSGMADIQVAAEYVVNAIRSMSAEYGNRIEVLGHSQGGMIPRWALRFWPDTRTMVDDVVGLAASNHGTTAPAITSCSSGCAPAFWQQHSTAGFIAALNSHQETFAGIDYTEIYTMFDTTVTPNASDSGSSSLHPGDGPSITNVAVQNVCSTGGSSMPSHLQVGTTSRPAYMLAVEAMDNLGPADVSTFTVNDPAVCASGPMPGVDTMTVTADFTDMQNYSNNQAATYPKVLNEPYVACYAVTPCGPPPSGGGDPPSGDQSGPTGKRAAALKKCKKKKGRARANCKKKAKKLPV